MKTRVQFTWSWRHTHVRRKKKQSLKHLIRIYELILDSWVDWTFGYTAHGFIALLFRKSHGTPLPFISSTT
jgi:hypothetical protein